MKIKDCEGCPIRRSKDESWNSYNCPWFKKDMICPCSICLVKMMCSDRCSWFVRHQIKVHDPDLVIEEWI